MGAELARILAERVEEVDEVALLEQSSYQLLCRIKEILDDESLTDERCFEKIERIVCAFEAAGVGTNRHDFG